VRLRLWTAVTNGHIVHPADDTRVSRATVELYWQGKTEEIGEKPVPVPLHPPQITHGLTRARTQASAVRGRRVTRCAHTSFKINLSSIQTTSAPSHRTNNPPTRGRAPSLRTCGIDNACTLLESQWVTSRKTLLDPATRFVGNVGSYVTDSIEVCMWRFELSCCCQHVCLTSRSDRRTED
jgi:hypothetical protein